MVTQQTMAIYSALSQSIFQLGFFPKILCHQRTLGINYSGVHHTRFGDRVGYDADVSLGCVSEETEVLLIRGCLQPIATNCFNVVAMTNFMICGNLLGPGMNILFSIRDGSAWSDKDTLMTILHFVVARSCRKTGCEVIT